MTITRFILRAKAKKIIFFVESGKMQPKVRFREALSERSGERIPLFPQKKQPQRGCFFCWNHINTYTQ